MTEYISATGRKELLQVSQNTLTCQRCKSATVSSHYAVIYSRFTILSTPYSARSSPENVLYEGFKTS